MDPIRLKQEAIDALVVNTMGEINMLFHRGQMFQMIGGIPATDNCRFCMRVLCLKEEWRV